MKKLLLLVPILVLASCGGSGEPGDIPFVNITDKYDAPFKSESSKQGKARIVDENGNPILIQSALLRTDLLSNADFMKAEEMEDYFAITADTNLNTIDVTLMWSLIEPKYNVYDFTELDYFLNYAKKYNLKLNIEWFGSFTDGETRTGNMPKYISEDHNKYPLIQDLFDFANYGHVEILDWSNSNLVHREQLALYATMNHIYDWNHENDEYNPVITVQLGQGVDRFQRWRVSQYKVPGSDGQLMSAVEAWKLANNYINNMGQAVKYSKYKAITRSEFCEQNAVTNYVRDIYDLEYVDLVCPTYLHEIPSMKNGIKSFVDECEDMAVLNVENWANDINHKQTLICYAMGGDGYVTYQLSSPRYFPESPSGTLYNRYNPNGSTLAEKFTSHGDRAPLAKSVNGNIAKASVAMANSPIKNFATFGLNTLLDPLSGDERIQKEYLNCGLLLDYSNPKGCLGYAVYDENYLYCCSDMSSSLTITNCTITVGQKGYFKDGEWVNEGTVVLDGNKTLNMEANVCYRVRMASISELPSSSELSSKGYKSTTDSIRS